MALIIYTTAIQSEEASPYGYFKTYMTVVQLDEATPMSVITYTTAISSEEASPMAVGPIQLLYRVKKPAPMAVIRPTQWLYKVSKPSLWQLDLYSCYTD